MCVWKRERESYREGFESFKWDEVQMAPFYGGTREAGGVRGDRIRGVGAFVGPSRNV